MTVIARSMLEQMYDVILKALSSHQEACQRLVELIAMNTSAKHFYQLLPKCNWLIGNPELTEKIMGIYNPVILQGIHSGMIGEIITEKLGENASNQSEISKSLASIGSINSEDRPTAPPEVPSQ